MNLWLKLLNKIYILNCRLHVHYTTTALLETSAQLADKHTLSKQLLFIIHEFSLSPTW